MTNVVNQPQDTHQGGDSDELPQQVIGRWNKGRTEANESNEDRNSSKEGRSAFMPTVGPRLGDQTVASTDPDCDRDQDGGHNQGTDKSEYRPHGDR